MYYYYYSSFDEDDLKGLKFLYAAIDMLAGMYPRMSVSTVHALLHIAGSQDFSTDQRINLTELARQLKLPYSSLTRHIEILGEGYPGRKGLGLVERVNLPGQRKEQYVRLSDKGIDLFQSMKVSFRTYESPKTTGLMP